MITIVSQNMSSVLDIPEDQEAALIEKILAGDTKTKHSGWYPVIDGRWATKSYINVNTGALLVHKNPNNERDDA